MKLHNFVFVDKNIALMNSSIFDKFKLGGNKQPEKKETPPSNVATPGRFGSTTSQQQPMTSSSPPSSSSPGFQSRLGTQPAPAPRGVTPISFTSPIAGSSQEMDESLFHRYREFIYQQSGIYFTDNKKYLLEGRISKRMEAIGVKSFEEYFQYISSPVNSRRELPSLYEAITINETYFFRNEPQFHALENVLLPEILKLKSTGSAFNKKIRIWSSASSSGEEAYTMAMIILEKIKPKYPQFQFEIVGTDINTAVVQKAQAGIYREYSIRNIPSNYMQKYMIANGDTYTVKPEVKSLVRFSVANLYDQAAMRSMNDFDIIFCCNVLIYFDLQSKQQVVANLYNALNPNGYLFIGYSESLHGVSKAFRLVHLQKTIAYKKE